jgi:hypothetical protein
MKVYDQNLTGASSAGSARTTEAQRTERGDGVRSGSSGAGSGDRVELSGALGTLARAMVAFSANGMSKVQALAAQYQDGTYQPDAVVTSSGMVAEALASGVK